MVFRKNFLAEVFFRIYKKENGGETIDHKVSGTELRKYMEEILPEYDDSRVYDSDLKKLFQWYNILHKNGLLNIDLAAVEAAMAAQQAQVENTNVEAEVVAEVKEVEEKPKKKAPAKKAADKDADAKPAKKTAAKKATKKDEGSEEK